MLPILALLLEFARAPGGPWSPARSAARRRAHDRRSPFARRLGPCLAVALFALASPPLAAQTAPFHWGYSAAFGRGTYQLDDGTEAQIYRAVIKPRIRRSPEDAGDDRGGPGVRLVLPVAGALLDSPADLLPLDESDHLVDAYAFMPGVELEFAPTERLTLRTTVQGGWGKELEGDEQTARLASFGVRTRLRFADAPARPALITGLTWAGVDPSEAERRSLLRLSAGVELDVGVPKWQVRGHSMRLLPHVLEDWYVRPASALALGNGVDGVDGSAAGDAPRDVGSETQIGVAAGRDEPFKILFLKFSAVGIAYRFSDRSEGLRLYLNSVF
ncbi:MAG TPA: hypothetical protein VFX89_06820 [Gammaproteobacteria bacterium]|nr:hypothetical protein [Gammaproteobacteria bacterium]